MSLSTLNKTLEETGTLDANITSEWVWGSNPDEPLTPTVMLNKCHLLGLLVCRNRRNQPHVQAPTVPRLTLLPTPPAAMNLRQLCDTLNNICLELPRLFEISLEHLPGATSLLDACFSRFGLMLAEGGPAHEMNDALCVEACVSNNTDTVIMKLNRQCIRRTLSIFMVLYRHVHLAAIARVITPSPNDCGICKHHMEASNDEFDLLCMRMKLPAAAVMNYKHDFTGFFSHISQVAYFHNPSYERTLRVTLTELTTAPPEQTLPALMQLYPDIKILYEEDNFDITKPLGYWAWIVLPGRIYLAGPNKDIYYSKDLTSLVRLFA